MCMLLALQAAQSHCDTLVTLSHSACICTLPTRITNHARSRTPAEAVSPTGPHLIAKLMVSMV
jgi:hypothetical protein